jgi:uncharacterized membrane protein
MVVSLRVESPLPQRLARTLGIMKSHLSEIAIALVFGAIWFALLFVPSVFTPLPKWSGALTIFVFCVFAVYIAINDDERRPTKSHSFRIAVGTLAGFTIAAVNQFQIEGYFIAAISGGLLG